MDDWLPFLAFRELDRGVTLEFRNDLTGVVMSFELSFVLGPGLNGTLFWPVLTEVDEQITGDPVIDNGGGLEGHLGEFIAATERLLATGVGLP